MDIEYIHFQFEKDSDKQTGYSSFFTKLYHQNQKQEAIENFQKLLEQNQQSNKLIVEFQNSNNEIICQFNELFSELKHLLKVPNIKVLIKNFNYGKYFLNGSYGLVVDFLDNFRHCLQSLEINMGTLFTNVEELSSFSKLFENAHKLNSFTLILKQQEKSEKAIQIISKSISTKLDSWEKLNFNFEQTSLDSYNFGVICQQIQQCKNLSSLSINLFYNKLDQLCGNDLGQALSQAVNLQSLFLDIGDNILGEGIIPLSLAIRDHKSLQNLKLFSRSNFIKEHFQHLLISLNKNKSLVNVLLNSRNNKIQGLHFEEGDLVQNKNIASLDLQIQEFHSLQIQKQILKYLSSLSFIENINFYGSLLLSADSLSIKQVFDTLFSLDYLTSFSMTCNRLMNQFEQKIFLSEYILKRRRTLYQIAVFQKQIAQLLNFSPIQTFFDIQFEI
ncbi:hypothetical protein TTHERM_001106219 (macronuclear) [Tetrahymena thermophila SB210]|uniref:Kinase domain protein n=1 Tax=Tetrahymena thermophila (strain SB210) TaxID=312017 RepID=W7XET4_TETTS|nr:hypothetical protein TTHERM_001106219 [Tetrahymena thermophila SB210]EWS72441.1 hypothetical protein TTHERM_001106219 [Tetrahymena thermophila SB210]|eukprot:XP_012655028.1 hypothetical protein TTHERM_001106219 [Tetrahymena thermophila SB210]